MAAVKLAIDRYGLGPLETNCYVMRAERGAEEAVIIDPGGDVTDLRLELARGAVRCVAILLTHGHWDHVLGVADLAEATGAPVYAAAAELPEIEQGATGWLGAPPMRTFTPDQMLSGGETLNLAGIEIEVIAAPGHRPGHLVFAAGGVLFVGDVLFRDSVGRTDLPGGDWDTLMQTLQALTERFPSETPVYPGHGPETTIGRELRNNPFLEELRDS